VSVLTTLLGAPLSDPYRLAESLGRSCPLILCGLAVAVAFRAQALNIGVEGQYLMGVVATAAIGVLAAGWPGWVLIPVMLAASACAGAMFAVPAAVLENRRGVPLVLSTILLNFVAIAFVSYLTQGPLRGTDPSAAQTDPIAAQSYLPALVPRTDLHAGFLLAVLAAAGLWVLLKWSTWGFKLRVAGANPVAAEWAGIRVRAVRLRVMCVSGALGGLAGGIQVAGVTRLLNIQASEGFGYVAIAVALLGRLHPLGVALAAVFIGMLDVGAAQLERQPALGIPADLAQVIKGMLVLMVLILSGPRLWRWMTRPKTPANAVPGFEPAGVIASPDRSNG
jgi:general nucleoside transport system permease protein